MLRLLINLLLLYIAYRLLRPVIRRGVSYVRSLMGTKPDNPTVKKGDYSDLTPYEIEDADFEEIKHNAD